MGAEFGDTCAIQVHDPGRNRIEDAVAQSEQYGLASIARLVFLIIVGVVVVVVYVVSILFFVDSAVFVVVSFVVVTRAANSVVAIVRIIACGLDAFHGIRRCNSSSSVAQSEQ